MDYDDLYQPRSARLRANARSCGRCGRRGNGRPNGPAAVVRCGNPVFVLFVWGNFATTVSKGPDMARSSASTDSHTYLAADSDEELYRAFADALKAVPEANKHRPALVAADGTEVPLPRELHDALLHVALALQAGMGVNVAPLNATLTTQECADYLGVSRPTIVRLLDSGEIPMSRPGRHRYVRLVDLIAHAEQVRRTRADALDELARDADAKWSLRDHGRAAPGDAVTMPFEASGFGRPAQRGQRVFGPVRDRGPGCCADSASP